MEFTKRELREVLREVLTEFFAERTLPAGDDDLLNVTQAARLLNLATGTVYEKTSLKKIRHYKKGKRILFKRSDLMQWMETGMVEAIDPMEPIEPIEQRNQVLRYLQSRDYQKLGKK